MVPISKNPFSKFVQMLKHTADSSKPLSPFVSLGRDEATAKIFGKLHTFKVRKMDTTHAWWNWFGEKEDLVKGGTKIFELLE